MIEMLKDDSAKTLSNVRNAITENNGTFAGYDVDASSIDVIGKNDLAAFFAQGRFELHGDNSRNTS